MRKPDKYEAVIELARRRGFFWSAYEIYGGVSGFIDLGPLGVALKNKIMSKWRHFFLTKHEFVEISTPIITPYKVFEASGHVEHFNDPIVECNQCNRKYKADTILKEYEISGSESLSLDEIEDEINKRKVRCPECNGELSKIDYFQTMFSTTIGPYSESIGYGRPETAQGIFTNFKRIYETVRGKFPLAIAQIGTVLRNEISPRQGPIRLREFTIMEFEFFYDPDEPNCSKLKEVENDSINILPVEARLKGKEESINITVRQALNKKYIHNELLAYFMALSQRFVSELGIPSDKQRFLEKLPNERAHYSTQTYDHEVLLDRWGWTEVSGHALRTDYDLSRHAEHSGVDLRVFKPYEKPTVKRVKTIRPRASVLQSKFNNTKEVMRLIQQADPDDVEREFRKSGEYKIGKYTIQPNDVKIDTVEIKESGKKFIPHVAEPSFGLDRLVYASLEYSYSKVDDRVVLRIPRDIAPIEAIVLPLVNKDGLPGKASEIYRNLKDSGIDVLYDEVGSIGRRYARADEIGIPIAITIDYQTMRDNTLTLRDRDSWKQVRVDVEKILESIENIPARKR